MNQKFLNNLILKLFNLGKLSLLLPDYYLRNIISDTRTSYCTMNIIRRIRNKLKRSFDGIRNEKLKHNLLQALPFWIASIIAGLIAVIYSGFFSFAEEGSAYILHFHHWFIFILLPPCFIISWWIVRKFAPFANGSGIPQVMAAIELANPKTNEKVNKLLSIKIIIVKICSSMFMALGGAITGREGPTIQIAGSVFRKINEWLPHWYPKISKRNMIMAGAAAGLAAAFNTPLGGMVFAVEELTKTHISYFKSALFTAVIIAGLTAQGLLGPYLYLGYPDVSNISPWIFPSVLLVAVAAGLAGSGMSKLILFITKWKRSFRFPWQHVSYLIVGGLIIALIAQYIDYSVLGSGKDIMRRMLFTNDKYSPVYLPVVKMAGSVISFTTGGVGGVFAPALSSGAGIGSVISGWFHLSASDSDLIILCGMVAFLTGVTRTPFTAAILVLEMTDRHNVIFYLMLAGMISGIVAMIVDKHSLYDHLKFQYLHDLKDEPVLEVLSLEEDTGEKEDY
jgi:H+/Cl- antiporter ClcA